MTPFFVHWQMVKNIAKLPRNIMISPTNRDGPKIDENGQRRDLVQNDIVRLERGIQGKGVSISPCGRAAAVFMNPKVRDYQVGAGADALSPPLVVDVNNVVGGSSGMRTRAGGGNRSVDFKKIISKTGVETKYVRAADTLFTRMDNEARQAELPPDQCPFSRAREQLFHNVWIFCSMRKQLAAQGHNGQYVCLGRFKVKSYANNKLHLVRVL